MIMILISSPVMTKLERLSMSLDRKYHYDKGQEKNDRSFSFCLKTYDKELKNIKALDTSKVSQQSDIPAKILKPNLGCFAEYFCEISTSVSQNQYSHRI